MSIVIIFLALNAFFFFVRKAIGSALFATLAGFAIYSSSGEVFVQWLQKMVGWPEEMTQLAVFLIFVLIMPMVIFLRAPSGGLRGILRIAEGVALSAILTMFLAAPMAKFLTFDSSSLQLYSTIEAFKTPTMIVGVILAYIDTIFHH